MTFSRKFIYHPFYLISFILLGIPQTSWAQIQPFQMTWLDIGEMHGHYSEVGAHPEGTTGNRGLEWPAILRHSGHYRAKSYWIGVKDWIDETGYDWEYRVAKNGPRRASKDFTPITSRLVAKFEPTEVLVNGYSAKENPVVVDEIDPDLPADRMLYQNYRSFLGIETERWIYAYAHETHDDYHIIKRRMINNGNSDRDANIEFPNQSLNEVFFFNIYRWVGRSQAGWVSSVAQAWGKFSMIDIVGDGHEEYMVDFTAIYHWPGLDPDFTYGNWNNIGSPMVRANNWTAARDTVGRLAGMSMEGRIVLHADESPTDRTYNPANQPFSMGWQDNDEVLSSDGDTDDRYYELAILTRQNPKFYPGGSYRNYPHWADLVEPNGEFWHPRNDASRGKSGGNSPTMAYGPYQMAFGDTVNIVEAEGAAGLSFKAANDIGTAYKNSGFDDDLRIAFDANGDGIITDKAWDYDVYKNGGEVQTKNQWVMTARDSLYQFMYRARDVWDASENMMRYPILEPPRPPRRFEVFGQPGGIDITWETMSGMEDPVKWELYRASEDVDNLPYKLIASLPGSMRGYEDTDVIPGLDYYYYIQAVGEANPVDERGLTGTPGGKPLKSGRYFTQTYEPVNVVRVPGESVDDFSIVPNPVNLASDQSVRFLPNGDVTQSTVEFLDIPGNCTISIYTEVGELVKRIEHTSGAGNATWDLLTLARQPVVSGIYLVRVADNDSGLSATKKLVLIK